MVNFETFLYSVFFSLETSYEKEHTHVPPAFSEAKKTKCRLSHGLSSHPNQSHRFRCRPAAYFESPLCTARYL